MSIHGHPFTVCLLFLTSLGSIELSPKLPLPPLSGGLQIVGKGGQVFGFTGIVEGTSVIVVDCIVDGMDDEMVDDSEMDEVVDSDFWLVVATNIVVVKIGGSGVFVRELSVVVKMGSVGMFDSWVVVVKIGGGKLLELIEDGIELEAVDLEVVDSVWIFVVGPSSVVVRIGGFIDWRVVIWVVVKIGVFKSSVVTIGGDSEVVVKIGFVVSGIELSVVVKIGGFRVDWSILLVVVIIWLSVVVKTGTVIGKIFIGKVVKIGGGSVIFWVDISVVVKTGNGSVIFSVVGSKFLEVSVTCSVVVKLRAFVVLSLIISVVVSSFSLNVVAIVTVKWIKCNENRIYGRFMRW